MPKFSNISRQRLDTCHPDLQVLFNEVIEHFDCSIVCGHRDEQAQNIAYEEGFSKLDFPESKHNKLPSLAVDAIPYPVDWKDVERMRHFAGWVLGIAALLYDMGVMGHRVRWGGDWNMNTQVNDQRFDDLPHFELVI
jgi:peptidoglycan LD-endopeptidase CwlK